ncbi:hypothetical protein B7Y94_00340 [Candidatus Saccharibacteria bacterium 32-49-12]|nr:MAG: hypothetical protein B7Y94_00340 [Candidatus Saccharibacteria bacterium 32-49-12]
MLAYHEVSLDQLGSVLENGLRQGNRGSKGDDKMIVETDEYLDVRCPKHLKAQGVSRAKNIYAYIRSGDEIIDIVDGSRVSIEEFVERSRGGLLEISVDDRRCFVSDLDTYDALKAAIEGRVNRSELERLADSYWSKVKPVTESADYRRPELMITYDLSPIDLTRLS